MEKLLSDIDISRSAPAAEFLELEAAARLGMNHLLEFHSFSVNILDMSLFLYTGYSTLPNSQTEWLL